MKKGNIWQIALKYEVWSPHPLTAEAYWLATHSYTAHGRLPHQLHKPFTRLRMQSTKVSSQVSHLGEMKYFLIQTLKITLCTLSNWILQMFLWLWIWNFVFVIERSIAFIWLPNKPNNSRMAKNHSKMLWGRGSDYENTIVKQDWINTKTDFKMPKSKMICVPLYTRFGEENKIKSGFQIQTHHGTRSSFILFHKPARLLQIHFYLP